MSTRTPSYPVMGWLLCLQVLACPAAAWQFDTPYLSYDIQSSSQGVALGDINGDGLLDIATSNRMANTVSILLNQGHGYFVYDRTIPTGAGPIGLTLADVTQDGVQDLIVACANSNSIRVHPSVGTGSSIIAAGQFTQNVRVADMNSDTIPDLVVAEGNSNKVALFMGLGGGSFAPAVEYASRPFPFGLVVADFNGDGKTDVAATCQTSGYVNVWLGDGNGALGPRADILLGGGPGGLAAGDFDKDGDLDLVCTWPQTFSSSLKVLANSSLGVFTLATSVPTNDDPTSVGVADVNMDGDPDLVVALNNWSGNLAVHFGGHGISFGAIQQYDGSDDTYAVAVGDLTGEGFPDAVTVGSRSCAVFLNRGAGYFGPNVATCALDVPRRIGTGRLNGDATDDIAVVASAHDTVEVFYSAGSGSLTAGPLLGVGAGPSDVEVVDINLDSYADIVSANYLGSFSVYLGTAGGTFVRKPDVSISTGGWGLAVKDLNHDGLPDVAVACQSSNKVSVSMNLGAGNFAPSVSYTTGSAPNAVAAGDVDGDGNVDLVTANHGGVGSVSVLWGTLASTYSQRTSLGIHGLGQDVCLSDVNGDGVMDIVAAANAGVGVMLGLGQRAFTSFVQFGQVATGDVAVRDFDHDGNLDIAAANNSGSCVQYWRGNGVGGFTLVASPGTGGWEPFGLAAGDFNNDGWDDLVAGNIGSPSMQKSISVLLNMGTATSGVFAGGRPLAKSALELSPPWPNPSAGAVSFTARAITPQLLDFLISDVQGRLVRQLATIPAGATPGTLRWDGRTDAGEPVRSGVYWLLAKGAAGSASRRITIIR